MYASWECGAGSINNSVFKHLINKTAAMGGHGSWRCRLSRAGNGGGGCRRATATVPPHHWHTTWSHSHWKIALHSRERQAKDFGSFPVEDHHQDEPWSFFILVYVSRPEEHVKVCQRGTKEQTKRKQNFSVSQNTLCFSFLYTDRKHKKKIKILFSWHYRHRWWLITTSPFLVAYASQQFCPAHVGSDTSSLSFMYKFYFTKAMRFPRQLISGNYCAFSSS